MPAVTATIGASGDYATWAALVADIANVVSASDDLTVELIDDAVYDETFDFSSIYSTVAVTSIVLTAGASARHDGTAGSGARIIRSANGAQNAAIVQFEDDCLCILEDLEVAVAEGFGWDRLVSGGTGGSPTGSGVVQRCILHDNRGRSANTAHSYGIFTGKADFVAQSNIIYNITHGRTGIDIYGICQLSGSTATNAQILCNTLYNIGSVTANAVRGIFLAGATSPDVIQNNLVIGLTAGTGIVACFQVASASVSHNASSDSTATGTGSLTSRAAGTEFRDTTAGAEDLLLSSSATVFEQGLDLGTSPSEVNLDILRRDRDSEGDTWSIGASQLTDAAVNAITLTSPQSYQVLQHNGGTASLTVSGTFTGTPTAIEYRFNGGSWTTLDAAPTGGVFSESITLNRGDQGTLEVRFTNDTDANASATFVGCGEVFAIFGQSNASGRGTNNRTYSHVTLKVGQYTGNGWQEMADPIDANANVLDSVADDTSTPGGHWAHKMCTDLMAGLSVPIGVLVVAKGGTGITSFLPGVDHLDRTTLYGSLNFHCNAVGGVKAVLWWQGETDAIAAMTQAIYNGHLDTIANALQTDRGVPLVACLLQNSSGITDGDEQAIRDAVSEAVGDNANVLQGPDFSAIASDDAFHLQTDTKVDNAGASWATSIFAELLPTVTLTEPSGIVLTGEVETLQWTTLGVSSVDVELSTDGGSNYVAIDSGNAGTSYAWTPATSQLSSDARIRVVDASDAAVSDVSGALKVATTSAVGGNYADPADVRGGTDRGDGTIGTLAVPAEGSVLEGVSVDDTVGDYHPVAPAEVAAGVSFGSNSSETGTFVGSGSSASTKLAGVSPLVGASEFPERATTPQFYRRHTTDRVTKMYCSLATRDESGQTVAVDLTGATVQFKMVNAGSSEVALAATDTGVEIEDASAGLVSYDFSSGAVSGAGRYLGYFILTVGGETDHYPAKVDDLVILIDDDLQSAERAFAMATLA